MARLKVRYQALCDAASSHAVWRQQWGSYSASTVGTLLTYSDARLARLQLVVELGQQGSHAFGQVLIMADDKWEQGAAQRAAVGAAPAAGPAQVRGDGSRLARCRPHMVQSRACYDCWRWAG
jgi:hypothetical protein